MANLNVVVLQGNLVEDPKVMGQDGNVARFTIAVNNGFGEHATTTYADCVAFGKLAGVVGKHLKKGKQVIVRGQLTQNRWEDKDGNKRSKIEVKLDLFEGFFFTGNANGNGASTEETEAEVAPAAASSDDGKLF